MSWRTPTTCWAAEETEKVIPVEAETPSDAVFLATHSSMPLFERDQVTDAKKIRVTNEAALLAAVAAQPVDLPILPILGRPGTGKSHLVRWLRAKLPEREGRRVIFVPKHRMSLRGIIELILEGITTDTATELRQKVATATESIASEEQAKLSLRSALAVLVEIHGVEMPGQRIEASADELDLRSWLASSDGLPALFGDPVFRPRVLAEDGPISRLAREKLQGRGNEDKEEAFGFSPDDLQMTTDDIHGASAAARDVAAALLEDEGARKVAARMLNEQLDKAVSQVFGVGGEDLKALLVEVRAEMHRNGQELLLLIEDFSIFQGIGGVVDAITLIPTHNNDLCPMRVVMAVTSGYFVDEMPDTAYSRVYKVFDLDNPSPELTFSPTAVAARYMNAIRVGAVSLEDAHARAEATPNACDQCPVNEACHGAFGAVEGYGLFPFNEHALGKAAKSKLVEGRLPVRDFLTRVLRPVLFNQHDDIDQHVFPNEHFNTMFRAGAVGDLDSVEDEQRLVVGDPEISKRRVVLVRFWGAGGSGPHNLAPAIHEAFRIPPVEGLTSELVKPDAPQTQPDPKQATHTEEPAPRQATPPLVQAVDEWRATGMLLQKNRNELRQLVHAAVLARLSFDDGLGGNPLWTNPRGKEWGSSFDAQAVGFDDQVAAGAVITLDRDDAEDARTLRALAWVNEAGDWRSVENGAELQRVVEERVSHWVEQTLTAIVPDRNNRDDRELTIAANTLLLMSKAMGVSDAFKNDATSKVRSLFASPPLMAHPKRPLLERWQQLVLTDPQRLSREQVQKRFLKLASFTQGTGMPLALDLPRVLRALRREGKESPPTHNADLLPETASSVRARLSTLQRLQAEATSLVPDISDIGAEVVVFANDLQVLVNERAQAGQLPGDITPSALSATLKAIATGDERLTFSTREDLDRWDDLTDDEKLRLITGDWDEAVTRVNEWFILATRAVEGLEKKFGSGTNSAAQLEYEQARDALIDALQDAVTLLEDQPEDVT